MEDILSSLNEILQRLQEVAPQVYATYLRQVRVSAYTYLGLTILALAAAAIMAWVSKVFFDSDEVCDDEPAFFFAFLAFLAFAAVVILIPATVGRFVNPDYYAIQMLLGR